MPATSSLYNSLQTPWSEDATCYPMSRFASLSGRKPVLRWPSTALFALAPERSKRVLGGKRHPGIQSVAVLRAALPLYPHASRRAVELLPRERRTQTPVTRHDHCISMFHAGYPKARSGRPTGLPEHVRTLIRDIHAPPPNAHMRPKCGAAPYSTWPESPVGEFTYAHGSGLGRGEQRQTSRAALRAKDKAQRAVQARGSQRV